MNATHDLHRIGQSLWLDYATRDLLNSGALRHYIEECSVTGLTSNPELFHQAIKNSSVYDATIGKNLKENKIGEELFFELALEDLCQAADLLRSNYDQTGGLEGWVSLDVSPRLIHDTESAVDAVKDLYARARRPNLFIKVPGTVEGLSVIEEAIAAGVPIHVTLLFSCEHYLAAAEAYLRGIERRIASGLKPNVDSSASFHVGCWDDAVEGRVPEALRNRLGIAIARRTYKACRELERSPRWERANSAGARMQRLMWVDTEARNSEVSDTHYISALAAPHTVNAMAESTLKALADHGGIGELMPADGGDCEIVLARFAEAGIDIESLAQELQDNEAGAFIKSWIDLMTVIACKAVVLTQAQQ